MFEFQFWPALPVRLRSRESNSRHAPSFLVTTPRRWPFSCPVFNVAGGSQTHKTKISKVIATKEIVKLPNKTKKATMEAKVIETEIGKPVTSKYKGKPENFKPNFMKGGDSEPTPQDKKENMMAKKLPSPTSLHLNANPSPSRDEPIWKEAIFAPSISVREKEIRVKFNLNASSLMSSTYHSSCRHSSTKCTIKLKQTLQI